MTATDQRSDPAASGSGSAAATRDRAAAPRAPKARVPFWDNGRFLAVVLVVMGHAVQRLTADSNAAYSVYVFIYAFHMPAFAVISGYFCTADPPGVKQMRRVLTDLVVPYIVMQAIWSLVQFLVEGKRAVNLTEPHWTLWFLLALAFFRLVLPYLALLRWPLLWSIIFSLGIGYASNVDSTFSLSRAIGLLPFFVMGWQLRGGKLMSRWQKAPARIVWPARAAALGLFGAWFAVAVVWGADFKRFQLHLWFFYDDSFESLAEQQWWAGPLRLGLIVLSVALIAAFFALIPRRLTWFTGFGTATLYVYLLHSFVLYPVRESGVLGDQKESVLWLISVLVGSVAIAVFLSSPFIRKVFRPLIEPKPRWIFRAVDSRPGGASRVDPTGSRRR
ncbi:MAG: acyltransferase family protein [Micrococcales bacterium]|nr:acyltransferase family protein [Micrococcales bacterium]